MPEPAALRSGEPRTIGPFRIRARLGSGGMGDVYLGTARRGRQVAIKLIRGAQLHDDEFRARFRREVRAVATVRSRHIANLVDADADAELPWLATEYIPGPTLSQAVAAEGPLSEADVLEVVTGVAEALAAVHRANLVHRDVKPGNVILGPDGPRLIDLGVVATVDATRVTLTGQPVGTPMYMAPEQAAGERATAAADVWALGALAYYAATGRHLYEGDHPAVVLYRVASHDPSYDHAPAYLRPFLDACLVKDPAGRPSLDGILRALGVPDQVETATVVPTRAALRQARRRPRPRSRARRIALAAAAGVVTSVVVGGTALGLWSTLGDGECSEPADEQPAVTADQPTAAPPAHPRREDGSRTGGASEVTAAPLGDTDAEPDADGSADQPWPLGDTQRLGDGSCWVAAVEAVEDDRAEITVSCDQAGTSGYGTPTPQEWLEVWAVGSDGSARQATAGTGSSSGTFWTQGALADPSAVALTVTLPDVGPLASVEIRHRDGYGWHWATTA